MRKTPFYLAIVVIVALALRLVHIQGRSLWFDEAASWQQTQFPLPDMLESIRLNVHMPLYYFLLKGTVLLLGDSVYVLRGYSVTFGLATVIAMFYAGRELYIAINPGTETGSDPDRETWHYASGFGLAIALCVALSAFQTHASIEARMYSQGTALMAVIAWLTLRATRLRKERVSWLALGVAIVAFLYTHPYALFSTAAVFAFLLFAALKEDLRGEKDNALGMLVRTLLLGAAVAVAFLPGLWLLYFQFGRVQEHYWIPPLDWIQAPRALWRFFIPTNEMSVAGMALASIAVVGAAIVLLWRLSRGGVFLLLAAFAPMAFAAAVSRRTPIWQDHYFRFAHLFVLCILVAAIWRITTRGSASRRLLLTGLASVLFFGNIAMWTELDVTRRTAELGACRYLKQHSTSDQLILVTSHLHYFPMKHYLGADRRIRLLAPRGRARGTIGDALHLIRPNDWIDRDEAREYLSAGLWVVSERGRSSPEFAEQTVSVEVDFFQYYPYRPPLAVRRYSELPRLVATAK